MVTELVETKPAEIGSPVLLETARRALVEAETLPEVTQLIDRAEVVRVAARKAELSRDAQNDWAAYKLDAERKAGKMLREMEKRNGGDATRARSRNVTEQSPPSLAEIGVSKMQSSRWQLLAELPDETYEAYKAEAREGGEVTEAGALRVAKHHKREEAKRQDATEQAATLPEAAMVDHSTWDAWLPGQPDCDLLLTDPPYSTDIPEIGSYAAMWLPMALAKVKPSGRAYVCIGAYPVELRAYLTVAPPEWLELAQVLVWTYRNTLGPKPLHDYKLNWQAILYYRGVDAAPLDSPEMVEQFAVQDVNAPDGRLGDRWHAWQKPDRLADRIIRHATSPGDLILDPFAGTGTFLLAAARLGRRARGCEPDPDMIAIATERGCQRAQ